MFTNRWLDHPNHGKRNRNHRGIKSKRNRTGKATKGGHLFLYKIIIAILAIGFAISAVPAHADSVSTPVQIGYSTVRDEATLGIPRWKGYVLETDPNRFWATYGNGSATRTQISYTTDGGESWNTNALQIDPDGYLNMHCSVFGRDGDLYATWPSRDAVSFRKFDAPIRSNDDAGPVVHISGTTPYYRSNIMVQNTGRIWLFTRLSYDDPAENVRFNYSDNGGASWTRGTAYATDYNSIRFGSMPYVNGNPALIVLYLNDARGLEYYLWNGTRFEAKPDHSIYPVNMRNTRAFTHNVIRDTTFHMVFGLGNELHHVWKNYNNGTGSWNHEIIDNSPYTTDMDWAPISTVRGDELYIFYAKKSNTSDASSRIYEMKWSQKTESWTDPILISTDASGVTDRDPNTAFQIPENSSYIPVYWTRGVGPFDIYFAKVNVDNSVPTPVSIDCPSGTINRQVCGASNICVPLSISNATAVSVDGGTWNNGTLCIYAGTSGLYTPTVTAYNSTDTASCDIAIQAQVDPQVTISCPADPVTLSNCTPTTMHVNLPITNQTSVRVTGATWANDVLTFDADTSGTYTYLVTASNDCGETSCEVVADVAISPNLDLNLKDEDVTLSNSEPTVGESITLSAAVSNSSGSLTASNVVVRFYDGDPGSGGTVIGSDQTIASLGGGATATVQVQYIVPDQNLHEIYAVVDPDHRIAECDENNNTGMLSVQGTAPSGFGTIDGTVSDGSMPLQGVTVDLLDGNGNHYLTDITDNDGYFSFDSVASGDYIVDLMVPLGFGVDGNSSIPVSLEAKASEVDFSLYQNASGDVGSYWWWKAQIQAIDDGTTLYEGLTRADIESYCETIFEHFYGRTDQYAIRIADVTYVGDPAQPLSFDDVARIWLGYHDGTNAERTRRHLLTCLLDVASASLNQMAVISSDGATASQAITYFAGEYMNGNSEDWTLWYNLSCISSEITVRSGVIPLSTPDIVYKAGENGPNDNLPSGFELSQNRPNPFNSTTAIRFTLSQAAEVRLEVYNVNGQLVENIFSGYKPAGTYTVRWDADAYASGIYFYRLTAAGRTESRKMVLLK